nr:hypothetical protein [Haemoproteus tartakovskyi]
MIFNSYSKIQKQILYKKFKLLFKYYFKKKNILNNILKSKNSNIYIYNKFLYKFTYITLIYINSNVILHKLIYIWYLLIHYNINFNNIYIILYIFTYF